MMRATSARGRLLALVALVATACGPTEPGGPAEPPGLLMVARTPDLARLLRQLSSLEGTPLAHGAAELADRLPDCGRVEAWADDGRLATLTRNLRCKPSRSGLVQLHDALGSASLAFATPEQNGVRARGRIRIDPLDDTRIELTIPTVLARGGAALLLPGDAPPGPVVLSGSETLLHARLRPRGGIDLAELVPAGGQGDRMFRLKSRLFAGAVLDGTWEAAIYLPGHDSSMPRAALALGFRARAPAVAAADEFLAQIEETWTIRRVATRLAGAPGACLPELRILPEFAPCYVTTRDALVVGYNPDSVRKALDGHADRLGDQGGVLVDLDRFPEADARLARASGAPVAPLARGPWRRLRLMGRAEEEDIHLRLHLEARDDV